MRVIDADKLYPDSRDSKGRLCISQSQIANAPTIILNALTIDAKRNKGEWIIAEDCEGKTRTCICKRCGHETGKYTWKNPNFCEECGADMRGDKE